MSDLRSTATAQSTSTPAAAGLAEFYDAPCLLFFAVEQGLSGDYVFFDSGLIVQSVCLAAYDRGLGTCIMAMAVRDPDLLREVLSGPSPGGSPSPSAT